MGDRKTAAQRVEESWNDFRLNHWPHALERIAALEALQKVVLGLAATVLAGVIASIILTLRG